MKEKSILVMEQVIKKTKNKHLEQGSTCGAAGDPERQKHWVRVRESWEESWGGGQLG